tara:strand:+ start:7026 stop:7430 length:405 start_codon:yes stop_codon:yes gene_type:complete
MKPFDYVNSINHNKKNLMVDTDNDKLAEDAYVPFLTNKSLSYFADTLMYSNKMNGYPHLDNRLQYEYLLNSIRPKKRFSKWVKAEDSNDLEMVKLYFDYSTKKAEQALAILSSDQINDIRTKVCGGISNESNSN